VKPRIAKLPRIGWAVLWLDHTFECYGDWRWALSTAIYLAKYQTMPAGWEKR
jgi:hypothetical protein